MVTDRFVSTVKEKSDLIAIGHPLEKIVLDDENNFSDEIVIRFKIDSLIKGNKSLKTILITQSSAGNCAIGLNQGEKYLITGEEVTSARQTYSMTQSWHDKKNGFVNRKKLYADNRWLSLISLEQQLSKRILKIKILSTTTPIMHCYFLR